MNKLKKYINGGSPSVKFLICLGFSAILLLLVSFIMALVAVSTENPGGVVGIFALASMLVSAIAGGIFSAKMNHGATLLQNALVPLALVLIMLLIAVIMTGGKVSGGAFMNYGCYLGVFILSVVFGKREPKRHRHKR